MKLFIWLFVTLMVAVAFSEASDDVVRISADDLISGEENCDCQFQDGKCCDGGKFCCPKGSQCGPNGSCLQEESTQANDENNEVPLLNTAEKVTVTGMCKDNKTTCGSQETCCMAISGMGCCPLPEAVCCSDKRHCCQKGQTCLKDGTCKAGGESFDLVIPADSEEDDRNEIQDDDSEAELVQYDSYDDNLRAIKQLEAYLLWSTKMLDTCPGSRYRCRPGTTCCKRADGKYNCCHKGQECSSETNYCGKSGDTCPGSRYRCRPGTTCCKRPDGKYNCCHKGQECSESTNWCGRRSLSDIFLSEVNPAYLSKGGIVICHNPLYHCQDGQTCCLRPNGSYGCCPYGYNVCCPGGVTCCPISYPHCVGHSCYRSKDAIFGVFNLPSSDVVSIDQEKSPDVCPDNKTKCKASNCCKRPDGQYNCCSQRKHCSEETNWCEKKNVCPNSQFVCPKDSTCCKRPNMKYNCCPKDMECSEKTKWCRRPHTKCPGTHFSCKFNTTCCKHPSGRLSCCPNGTECSEKNHWCVREVPAFDPEKEEDEEENEMSKLKITCPDGKHSCPTGTTCCRTRNGYGCCRYANATCCSDLLHCCPHNMKCDTSQGSCIPPYDSPTVPMAVKEKAFLMDSELKESTICPDGNSKCQKEDTCCLLNNGKYGCCRFKNATCCSDGKHCCPTGYQCDSENKTCVKKN